MREFAAAALLLLALVIGALAPKFWPDDAASGALVSGRPAASGPLATAGGTAFAAVSWKGKDGGTGFVVCGSTQKWSRPSLADQNAHLASEPRYAGMRADDTGSPAWRPFHASALAYDGSSVSTRVDLIALSGMWTDPQISGNAVGCTSIEPQLWLVGYEPLGYTSTDKIGGMLAVRPATGYSMVVLTAAPQAVTVVSGGTTIADFDLVKDLPPRAATPKPVPTPTNKAVRSPLVPIFPRTDQPLELAMPSTCSIETARRHYDDLGMTWRVQCGSATANLTVAPAAIEQGWELFRGNPPIGVGLQNYSKNDLWMQIAYRLDGPAYADAFVVVQTLRPGVGGYDSSPHDFTLGPWCGIVDQPTRSADGSGLSWLARCGNLDKAIIDSDAINLQSGWTLSTVGTAPSQTRRYCKLALETVLRTGSDLGAGIMAITQTEGACR